MAGGPWPTCRDDAAGTVLQNGRAKAFRPLPPAARRHAFEEALAAYGRGDFFETHELLEPAWMGTDDPAERDLLQGLIKLAAAFVHGVRGNPAGIAKNLVGARALLAAAAGSPAARHSGLDLTALVAAIDDRLARFDVDPTRRFRRCSRPAKDRPPMMPPRVPSVAAGDAAAALGDAAVPRGPAPAPRRRPRARRVHAASGSRAPPSCRSRSSSPAIAELPKDRPLLMLCHSGSRSQSATMYLLQAGWTDVRNVEGGIVAWMRAGLPVRRGTPDAR